MSKSLLVLGIGVVLLFGVAADAQPDTAYVLRLSSGDTGKEVGDTQEIDVTLTNAGEPLLGYSFGVCHNDLVSIEEVDIVNGATPDDADYFFHDLFVDQDGDGWAVGALLDFQNDAVIDLGNNLDMYTATYSLDAEGTAALQFCETVGDPVLTLNRVVVEDSSGQNVDIEPVIFTGIINIAGDSEFQFAASSESVPYSPDDGIASFTTDVSIKENSDNAGFPSDTQGFKFGLAHNADHVTPTDAVAVGDVADLDGGSGPAFIGVNLAPANGDGVTVGVVYYFMPPAEFIQFDVEKTVVEIDYDADVDALEGNEIGLETLLVFDGSLATPTIDNAVVVGNVENLDVGLFVAKIEFTNGDAINFKRADADNNGSVFGLVDAVYILEWAFNNGPGFECEDAGDVDGNGVLFALVDVVYLLEWSFNAGPEPPAPGPTDCGPDANDTDSLGCETPPAVCL